MQGKGRTSNVTFAVMFAVSCVQMFDDVCCAQKKTDDERGCLYKMTLSTKWVVGIFLAHLHPA